MARKKDQSPQPELEALDANLPEANADAGPQEPESKEEALPPQPELEVLVPSTPAEEEKRYRVWKHGGLNVDGQEFKAGEDVPYGLRHLPCVEAY